MALRTSDDWAGRTLALAVALQRLIFTLADYLIPDFEPGSHPGLPRARVPSLDWCGQPVPWGSLFQGFGILSRPFGQVDSPVAHQDTSALKKV